MKKIFLPILLSLMAISSQAQSSSTYSSSYRSALGVKVWGDGGGISFKHFFIDNQAGEFIGYFWTQGSRLTALYEIHGNFAEAPGLKWYIGPGAHLGFYSTKFGGGTFVGVDGVLGLDYKFKAAPINLSLDWQPSFEFGTNRGFYGNWGGLGIRYTF